MAEDNFSYIGFSISVQVLYGIISSLVDHSLNTNLFNYLYLIQGLFCLFSVLTYFGIYRSLQDTNKFMILFYILTSLSISTTLYTGIIFNIDIFIGNMFITLNLFVVSMCLTNKYFQKIKNNVRVIDVQGSSVQIANFV